MFKEIDLFTHCAPDGTDTSNYSVGLSKNILNIF